MALVGDRSAAGCGNSVASACSGIDTGLVRGNRAKQTFAQIAADVRSAPVQPPPRRPGLYGDELVGPEGRVYRQVGQEPTSERAMQIIHGGGQVVVDACGCGGYCGLQWLSAAEVSGLTANGLPLPGRTRKRRRTGGCLHEFVGADGERVLLLSGDVRWAR